ncbi:MAG: glucosylceramidase [Spirochaetia bacterium]|nr:glucosylceramidase [Spirochaetia bacterium]
MMIQGERTFCYSGDIQNEFFGLQSIDDSDTVEKECLNIYPEIEYQQFKGFGCAITEAVGSVLNTLDASISQNILEDCFSSSGLNYTWIRCPIDSCDFSLAPYTSCIQQQKNVALDEREFASHDGQYIIPWIKRASQLSKRTLSLYLVPWSPPAWMKTNSKRDEGGALLAEHKPAWASYMASYVKRYEEQGLVVSIVGVQNEPNAAQKWDSCLYTAEEEHDFILEYLYPALLQANLDTLPLITVWDHNKERLFERVREVCQEDVSAIIGAASFHWYSGDHFDQVALVSKEYPQLLLIFSEGCIEYSEFSSDAQIAHAQHYAHQIIGDLNHGTHIWLDWNMVLAENGGPNHAGNFCDAPILCNLSTKSYQKRLTYYYIRHFSRYIVPGSIRIAHSLFTADIEATAWKRPDGSIVTVIHNPKSERKNVYLRSLGQLCSCTLEGESITTLTFVTPRSPASQF